MTSIWNSLLCFIHHGLASLPGLPQLQFLIACSMHKQRYRWAGKSYHVIHDKHDVTGSRHKDIHIYLSSYTEGNTRFTRHDIMWKV